MARIVVVGSMNMDLVASTPRLPTWGEVVQGGGFRTAPGGKGANQATAAGRLGARCSLIGRVGADGFGRELRAGLTASGVDVRYLREDPDSHTGVALILLNPDGQNCIVITGGANLAMTAEDIAAADEEICAADMVLVQLAVATEAVRAAAQAAARYGVPLLLDPAPAHGCPPDLVAAADLVAPNETEVQEITGEAVTDLAGAERAARRLLEMGAKAAVVKLGPRGAFFMDKERSFHVPGFLVDVVDTTAAGDAFAGALAVALAEGKDMGEAITFANGAGALSVTVFGAQPSMPTREAVEAFLAKAPTLQ